jgi:F0F1-type ATP synthase assembly protein I
MVFLIVFTAVGLASAAFFALRRANKTAELIFTEEILFAKELSSENS